MTNRWHVSRPVQEPSKEKVVTDDKFIIRDLMRYIGASKLGRYIDSDGNLVTLPPGEASAYADTFMSKVIIAAEGRLLRAGLDEQIFDKPCEHSTDDVTVIEDGQYSWCQKCGAFDNGSGWKSPKG